MNGKLLLDLSSTFATTVIEGQCNTEKQRLDGSVMWEQ